MYIYICSSKEDPKFTHIYRQNMMVLSCFIPKYCPPTGDGCEIL